MLTGLSVSVGLLLMQGTSLVDHCNLSRASLWSSLPAVWLRRIVQRLFQYFYLLLSIKRFYPSVLWWPLYPGTSFICLCIKRPSLCYGGSRYVHQERFEWPWSGPVMAAPIGLLDCHGRGSIFSR